LSLVVVAALTHLDASVNIEGGCGFAGAKAGGRALVMLSGQVLMLE
jgi:hypothetical protein